MAGYRSTRSSHPRNPRKARLGAALAAALLPLAPAVALAQAARPAETTLPEVTVKGEAERADGPVEGYRATRSGTFTKTDTPLKDVPASVTVVPAQLMKDQAMQGMGDVFRYVPGTLAHQGEGNRDQIILRGTSTTADFYVDGVRDDAQVFRDLYNLERVEVLKGPGGMAFGRGGAGGVVNRVTRKPVAEWIGNASVTYGSWNQLRGTVDLGDKLGESGAWRLNAMVENADSFRNGASMERAAINPTAFLALGSKTSLTVGFEYLRDDRTADRGFPSQGGAPFNAPVSTFFGNADQSHARSVVEGAYATLEHDFGGWQLKNTLRAMHYDKFYQNVYPGGGAGAGSGAIACGSGRCSGGLIRPAASSHGSTLSGASTQPSGMASLSTTARFRPPVCWSRRQTCSRTPIRRPRPAPARARAASRRCSRDR